MFQASRYSKEIETAIKAANAGGRVLASQFGNTCEAFEKDVEGENLGLVTEADYCSERAILEVIRNEFPEDSILSEESAFAPETHPERQWIIDPLDGTNNFAHEIPYFSVSIALWIKDRPTVGVVFDPIASHLFAAIQGEGAWLNQKKLQVSSRIQMEQAMIGVGFYYDRGDMMRSTLQSIHDLFTKKIRGIRRFGAASLDLAWVATGRFDAFFEYRLAPWDFAAGVLLVEEAGGIVTTTQGLDLQLGKSSILATNRVLHESLLETVSKNWPD